MMVDEDDEAAAAADAAATCWSAEEGAGCGCGDCFDLRMRRLLKRGFVDGGAAVLSCLPCTAAIDFLRTSRAAADRGGFAADLARFTVCFGGVVGDCDFDVVGDDRFAFGFGFVRDGDELLVAVAVPLATVAELLAAVDEATTDCVDVTWWEKLVTDDEDDEDDGDATDKVLVTGKGLRERR